MFQGSLGLLALVVLEIPIFKRATMAAQRRNDLNFLLECEKYVEIKLISRFMRHLMVYIFHLNLFLILHHFYSVQKNNILRVLFPQSCG